MYFGSTYLTEEVIAKTNNISIQINPTPDTSFKFDPYIKVYTGQNISKASGVARVYLKDAKYVRDHRGKKIEKLTAKQEKELNDIMHAKDDNGITNYEKALAFTIRRCNLNDNYYKDYKEIPSFLNIDYRKDKSGKDKK